MIAVVRLSARFVSGLSHRVGSAAAVRSVKTPLLVTPRAIVPRSSAAALSTADANGQSSCHNMDSSKMETRVLSLRRPKTNASRQLRNTTSTRYAGLRANRLGSCMLMLVAAIVVFSNFHSHQLFIVMREIPCTERRMAGTRSRATADARDRPRPPRRRWRRWRRCGSSVARSRIWRCERRRCCTGGGQASVLAPTHHLDLLTSSICLWQKTPDVSLEDGDCFLAQSLVLRAGRQGWVSRRD